MNENEQKKDCRLCTLNKGIEESNLEALIATRHLQCFGYVRKTAESIRERRGEQRNIPLEADRPMREAGPSKRTAPNWGLPVISKLSSTAVLLERIS